LSTAAAVQFPSSVKSAEAFRTISEVATELDVPQHVLRFWESRFAQVKPTKRAGGRRYYRPEDVDLLRGIRALLYSDGYTIKGVQKLLRERGLRYVADIGRESTVMRPAADRPERVPAKPPAILRFERAPKTLADEEREKLEALLDELLELKSRMRAAPRSF
jgi:DNA-binding transcriptional MerR regulator